MNGIPHRLATLFAFLALTLITSARADVNELSGATILPPVGGGVGGGGSGGGDGDAQYQVSASTIRTNDTAVQMNGREYKAGDAFRLARDGENAAKAAGAAYMASAIPKLASPIAAIRALGARLMRKSMMEFAQAAADRGVANKNKGQKDLLTAEAGQSGAQQDGKGGEKGTGDEAIDGLRANPELKEFFAERGINGDAFIDQISSGKMTEDDAWKTLGEDPAKIEAAAVVADSLPSAGPEALGTGDQTRLGMDDGAKGGRPEGAGAGGGGGAGGSDGKPGTVAGAMAGDLLGGEGEIGLRRTAASRTAVEPPSGLVAAAAKAANVMKAFYGLMEQSLRREARRGGDDEDDEDGVAARLVRMRPTIRTLQQAGIARRRSDMTLFDLASAHYRAHDARGSALPSELLTDTAAEIAEETTAPGPSDLLSRARSLKQQPTIAPTPWPMRLLAMIGFAD